MILTTASLVKLEWIMRIILRLCITRKRQTYQPKKFSFFVPFIKQIEEIFGRQILAMKRMAYN